MPTTAAKKTTTRKATPALKTAAKPTSGKAPARSATPQSQASMSLLPSYTAMGVPDNIPLTDLPNNAELIGPEPDEAFVTNVKQFGVMQSVILVRKADGSYAVGGGRRRIKAARVAKLSTIPALVYPDGWVSHDVITQIENQQRSENVAADLAAIEALIAQGAGEKEINEATGKPILTIRQLLKLKALIPKLRQAFNEGKFTDRVAYRIVALNAADQKKLISTLARNSKLVRKDVDLLVAATIQPKPAPAAATLTPTTVAPAPTPAPEPADDRPWYEQALDLVKQIQGLTPPSATKDIGELCVDLIQFLEYEEKLAAHGGAAPAQS